jgi:hypothetical protein
MRDGQHMMVVGRECGMFRFFMLPVVVACLNVSVARGSVHFVCSASHDHMVRTSGSKHDVVAQLRLQHLVFSQSYIVEQSVAAPGVGSTL